MITETRTIEVQAYRDPDGAPTCCADWTTARCRFITLRKFGLVDVCACTGEDLQRLPAGAGYDDPVEDPWNHYVRPVAGCPIWGDHD